MATATLSAPRETPQHSGAAVAPGPLPSPGQALLATAEILGRYPRNDGDHEILAADGPGGRVLILDTAARSLAGARVVAILDAEEPRENARLLAAMYLADPTRGRCRRLHPEDLDTPDTDASPVQGFEAGQPAVINTPHCEYAIRPLLAPAGGLQLRWTCSRPSSGEPCPVTLRELVGALESYEPARAMTARALARPTPRNIGTSQLATELARLTTSPIVLNRGLREAVEREVSAGTTMSAIAMRCGRLKSDRNGNRSGETSWLARRIGQMPEGGQAHPTPWIHSDTLALIARDGLGVSPREVEL